MKFNELDAKQNNEPKYNPITKKETPAKNNNLNPFIMVVLSGVLGLVTSILVLKYVQRVENNSINPQQSNIFLLEKNIYF